MYNISARLTLVCIRLEDGISEIWYKLLQYRYLDNVPVYVVEYIYL